MMSGATNTSAVILVETASFMIQLRILNFKSERIGYWVVSVESLS